MKTFLFYILSASALLFVGLKMAGKIDWSWWWVFSPIWISVAFIVFAVLVRLGVMWYLYNHDEQYREALDEYKNASKQGKTTLADRLKELQEQRMKRVK